MRPTYTGERFRSVEVLTSINRRYFTDKSIVNDDIPRRQILNITINYTNVTLCRVRLIVTNRDCYASK